MKRAFIFFTALFVFASIGFAGEGVNLKFKKPNGKPCKYLKVSVETSGMIGSISDRVKTGSDGYAHVPLSSKSTIDKIYVNGKMFKVKDYYSSYLKQGRTYYVVYEKNKIYSIND